MSGAHLNFLLIVAVIATTAGLLIALRLRRYRLHWHFASYNLEFHKRSNYTAAGRPWLLAFEITSLIAFVAWIAALTVGRP